MTKRNTWDEFVYFFDENNLKGIRKGQWKLVFPCVSRTYNRAEAIGGDGFPGMEITQYRKHGIIRFANRPWRNPRYKRKTSDIVRKLTIIADKYRKELGDGLTNQTGSGVRAATRVQ
jgi:hypothetical protein